MSGVDLLSSLGGALAAGTSFPLDPTLSDRFFRTDRKLVYIYDGTNWVSEQLFTAALVPSGGTFGPFTAASTFFVAAGHPEQLYIEQIFAEVFSNADPAANYMTIQLQQRIANSVVSFADPFDLSAANGAVSGQYRRLSQDIGELTDANRELLFAGLGESGTANQNIIAGIAYRLVG